MPGCDCLTGCAHTYREARAEHKEKEAEFEAVFDKKAEAAARQVRRHPSAMLAVF